MAQGTTTLVLDAPAQEALERAVRAGGLELRSVDHARFSARAPGVTATLYRSGKLVVQGEEVASALFLERYLGAAVDGAASAAPAASSVGAAAPARPGASRAGDDAHPTDLHDGPLVGGDESGKGDYFGPLVVAAVRLAPGDAARLRAGGVRDSKSVSDGVALRVGGALRSTFPCAVRVLDPPEYRRRHERHGNVALLLAELYREVVAEVHVPGCSVWIDQFSRDRRRLADALAGLDVRLFQEHRGERVAAVAAASLIAREAFLVRLRELGDELGVPLPKGAGPPVLAAGAEVLRLHGKEGLERAAKTHFQTTRRLLR